MHGPASPRAPPVVQHSQWAYGEAGSGLEHGCGWLLPVWPGKFPVLSCPLPEGLESSREAWKAPGPFLSCPAHSRDRASGRRAADASRPGRPVHCRDGSGVRVPAGLEGSASPSASLAGDGPVAGRPWRGGSENDREPSDATEGLTERVVGTPPRNDPLPWKVPGPFLPVPFFCPLPKGAGQIVASRESRAARRGRRRS